MSYENALVAHARRPVLAAKAEEVLRAEVSKGCSPVLSDKTVPLEPPYYRMAAPPLIASDFQPLVPEEKDPKDFRRAVVWVAPEHAFDWVRAELFLKQLQGLTARCAMEFHGNADGITQTLFFHKSDAPIVESAFQGQFEMCSLSPGTFEGGFCSGEYRDTLFRDFYPLPPYSQLLTRSDELRYSPFEPLLQALAHVPPPACGLYQVAFQPTRPEHDWHANIELIQDLEFALRQWNSSHSSQRMFQQAPSGDLRNMAWELETKAHRDKPIFAVAIRIAAQAETGCERVLTSLASFLSVFQHGGKPLRALTEADYRRQSPDADFHSLIDQARTFRHGFLLNSAELSGLAHIPPGALLMKRRIPMSSVVRPELRGTADYEGVRLGTCHYAGQMKPVRIPDYLRRRHAHLIGVPDMGKTSAMENLIRQDIERGAGVAVLDPHGDLIERLLCLIPGEHVERTIYFDPGDPDWVPLWNMLLPVAGQDAGRAADDLVAAFKSIVFGWGDRLEHLLRHTFFGLMHRPGSTLLDAAMIVRTKGARGGDTRAIREEVVRNLNNPMARQFWKYDVDQYRREDFAPVQHKLSKLLVSDTVSRMLSQPESRISLPDIMNAQRVFLANLSTVGSETREVLGKLLLSFFHLNALNRSSLPPEERLPFYIYCDEAHRFLTDAIEDLLVETRKYGVGLTMAHQHLSQFDRKKIDALSSVGTAILFRVDARDAGALTKDMMGRAGVDDLVALEPRHCIARMGSEVFQFVTDDVMPVPEKHHRERIIEESRRRFYRRADEFGDVQRSADSSGLEALCSVTEEEFTYDEF